MWVLAYTCVILQFACGKLVLLQVVGKPWVYLQVSADFSGIPALPTRHRYHCFLFNNHEFDASVLHHVKYVDLGIGIIS